VVGPPLRALGPNSSGGYCVGGEWRGGLGVDGRGITILHFRFCLTRSQIPCKGVMKHSHRQIGGGVRGDHTSR